MTTSTDGPLARVQEEYLWVSRMFEQIETGDREALFYHLRDIYTAMRYHLNLFHLACVRAFERFQPDEDLQLMCLGAFYEYSPRPELLAFRRWFEVQQSNPNERVRRFISALLEMCDLAQAEYDRDLTKAAKQFEDGV